jgi:hypothetical protein
MAKLTKGRLAVSLPAGWQPMEAEDQIVAVGPAKSGARPNILLTVDASNTGETAESFAKKRLPEVRASLQGFALKSEGPAEYGKFKGFAREQTFSAGGKPIWQLQFWFVDKSEVYCVTFSDAAERADAARRTAKQMIAGARLT